MGDDELVGFWSNDVDRAWRGDGVALDLRGAVVSLSERFAVHLQRQTRVLELRNVGRGVGGWPLDELDFAYLRPEGPDVSSSRSAGHTRISTAAAVCRAPAGDRQGVRAFARGRQHVPGRAEKHVSPRLP